MAVLAHCCPAAQHGAHVDHGAVTHHSADVQNRAHHDDGVFPDLHLLPDDGTRLDAGGDILQIQHGNGGVAAAVFDLQILEFIGFQHRRHILPVPEDDLLTGSGGEDPAAGEFHGGLFPDIDLDRRLLLGGTDIFNDFLGVHNKVSFSDFSHHSTF